jgi:hypothetical protein
MVDPVSISASLLAGQTVSYLKSKGKKAKFMADAIDNAGNRLGDRHEGLNVDAFLDVFTKAEIEEAVQAFDAGADPITAEEIADAIDPDEINADVSTDELVDEFLDLLEQEVSADPAIGNKILTNHTQRIHDLATELDEGQEDVLLGIQEIKGQVRESAEDKGYEVFQSVEDYYDLQLQGDHPNERYDLPFYGRHDEIAAFIQFVESDRNVLIVTGPTGIGKTRLVVEGSLRAQTSHPDWQVYTADLLAGNIDEGLSEIDLEQEDGVILFVDDARDTDQVDRMFDLADKHRDRVKLVFTERPYFVEHLQENAGRFSLSYSQQELRPINTEDLKDFIRDSYGITAPTTLDWITHISEGRPQIAHLVADALASEDDLEDDPIAESEDIHNSVFMDAIAPLKDAAADRQFGDPQKIESYVEYLAAVGRLDTSDDDFMDAFRNALDLSPDVEARYRNLLTETQGLVYERGQFLEIQPDVLREYLVFDTFFDGSARDFKAEVYDRFGQFTEDEQASTLLAVNHRYGCRGAGRIVEEILAEHRDRMEEYSVSRRVNLLRDYSFLGSAKPVYGIDLVDAAVPDEASDLDEEDGLSRVIVKAPSPVGNLCLAANSILHSALLREPKAATERLIEIANTFSDQGAVADDAIQKLRQELEPGLQASPAAQKQVVEALWPYLLNRELASGLKRELIDVVGVVSNVRIHDFSLDPVDRSTMRTRTGPIRITEDRQNLRLAVIDLLIDMVEAEDDADLQREAVDSLTGFYQSQTEYYYAHDVVYNEEELDRIYEFAIDFVADDGDLQCIQTLSKLDDPDHEEALGVEEKAERLRSLLDEHSGYQLMNKMNPKTVGRGLEERDEEIREFLREREDVTRDLEEVVEIVESIPNQSFTRFFQLLGEEHPETGINLIENPEPSIMEYLPNIVFGVCVAQPESGKGLVTEFISEGQIELTCAGLRAIDSDDHAFVVEQIETLLDENAPYNPEFVSNVARVVHGQWDDNQDWIQSVILRLFENARTLTTQAVDNLLLPLPLHDDEQVQAVEDDILFAVLAYAEEQGNLSNESHDVSLAVAETAARYPDRFVEFCLTRCENEYAGTALLPPHLDIDTERMRAADEYDQAVKQLTNLILDTDGYHPLLFNDLSAVFPTRDIADHLISEIPGCSDEQLVRVIQYCRQFAMTEPISDLYLAIMENGVDDIRDAESIKNCILAAISTDPTASIAFAGADLEGRKERELETLQEWQDDPEREIGVKRFADEAEQYLRDDIERMKNFVEY